MIRVVQPEVDVVAVNRVNGEVSSSDDDTPTSLNYYDLYGVPAKRAYQDRHRSREMTRTDIDFADRSNDDACSVGKAEADAVADCATA